jgi:glutaredoxin
VKPGGRGFWFTISSQALPTVGAMTGSDLRLVTSHDCHLCVHGRSVLNQLGLAAREIDVESDEARALADRGAPLSFLPVLIDGDHVVAYGRFSEKRLRKELGI